MELLGKAARVFSGIPVEPPPLCFAKRSSGGDNTRTPRMFEPRGLESEGRVPQAPKIRETFAGPAHKAGQKRLEREKPTDSFQRAYF
jgi:hypothetical protein